MGRGGAGGEEGVGPSVSNRTICWKESSEVSGTERDREVEREGERDREVERERERERDRERRNRERQRERDYQCVNVDCWLLEASQLCLKHMIREMSHGEHLPQGDPIAPDISFGGEASVL